MVYLWGIIIAAFTITATFFSAEAERGFWGAFGDLDLGEDCARLSQCLRLNADVDTRDNRCVVHKGDYLRRFHIPELRGSLRVCEIMRDEENQRKHGI